eukprot:UN09762
MLNVRMKSLASLTIVRSSRANYDQLLKTHLFFPSCLPNGKNLTTRQAYRLSGAVKIAQIQRSWAKSGHALSVVDNILLKAMQKVTVMHQEVVPVSGL